MRCITRKEKRNLKIDGNLSIGAGACFMIAATVLSNWPLGVVGLLCVAAGYVRQQPPIAKYSRTNLPQRRMAKYVRALDGMPMKKSSALLMLAIPFNLAAAVTQCPPAATAGIVGLSILGNIASGLSDNKRKTLGFGY